MIKNISFLNVYKKRREIVSAADSVRHGFYIQAISICGMKKNGGFYGL